MSVVVPRRRDPGAACAAAVVADFQQQLPDLGRAVILVPEALQRLRPQFVELRARLLECARARGCDALIPPLISTPWRLFLQRSEPTARAATGHERELLLADELENSPGSFPRGGLWQTTDELLRFFDEVSELDDARDDDVPLEQSLRRLGGHWSTETEILLAVWRAWNETAPAVGEQRARYRRELMSGGLLSEDEHAYLCGFAQLTPCQAAWARKLEGAGRLTRLPHAPTRATPKAPPAAPADASLDRDDACANVLDRIFERDGAPLCQRARATAARFPASPLAPRLRVFRPRTLEEHAWGLCLTIREWLRRNKSVGVVSLDRRLTRRLRALLERRGLALYDYSGWELSTTSSAGALRNLLALADGERALEEHVALLRSPWCEHPRARADVAAALHHVEQCDARADYPPRTTREWIARLRKGGDDGARAAALAERVIAAAAPLRDFAASDRRGFFSDFFDHLLAAMEALGMRRRFEADDAGERLLVELRDMREAAGARQKRGTFRAWRGWLAHGLENANFYPPPQAREGVLLMNLNQSRLARFDALAVAGLDRRHLPAAARTGLVSEKIRRELNLETREQRDALQFGLFRRLLERGADTILLSCERAANGRALEPSPWLRAIEEFHRLAYDDDLEDAQLARRARHAPQLEPRRRPTGAPARVQRRPAPAAPRDLWPEPLSAAAHQALVDCPYRFFARYALRLTKPRTAVAHWSAAEYGSHLHRCLQALHQDLAGLPGPMDKPWSEENRAFALHLAGDVVGVEFSRAVEANRANRYWRDEALAAIAWYVDWMIKCFGCAPARSFKAEHKLEAALGDGAGRVVLGGRLDLVAEDDDGTRIIDYKSGRLPTKKAVEQGEEVQLPSYALLAQDVRAVSYLGLRRGDRRLLHFDQEQLAAVRERMRARLLEMRARYDDGHPLPAWGAEATCRHCDYQGLCRRPAWLAYSQ